MLREVAAVRVARMELGASVALEPIQELVLMAVRVETTASQLTAAEAGAQGVHMVQGVTAALTALALLMVAAGAAEVLTVEATAETEHKM